MAVADHEIGLRSTGPAFQPVLAREMIVCPKEFWNSSPPDYWGENGVSPGRMAERHVVMLLPEQAREMLAGGHDRERISRAHFWQSMDRLTGRRKLVSQLTIEAEGELECDGRREVQVLNTGQNCAFDSTKQVAAMNMENGEAAPRWHVGGPSRQADGAE